MDDGMLMDTIRLNGVEYDAEKVAGYLRQLRRSNAPGWLVAVFAFLADFLGDGETMRLQTSGSTGTPKQITVAKAAMRASAGRTLDFFGLEAGCRALLCLPAGYVAGKMMLVRAIVGGWQLFAEDPSSAPNASGAEYDFVAMTPMQLRGAARCGGLDGMASVIFGGAPLAGSALDALGGRGARFFETYGMTETLTHVAVREVSDGRLPDFFEALPGVSLGLDARGCLVVDDVVTGITGLVTNDVAELVDDGRFRLLGRIDNVINSGGVKLFPEVIERKIAPLMGDRRFFIGCVDDAVLGQRPVLYVEGRERDLSLDDLAVVLERYELPVEIRWGTLPGITAAGKVVRNVELVT